MQMDGKNESIVKTICIMEHEDAKQDYKLAWFQNMQHKLSIKLIPTFLWAKKNVKKFPPT